MFNIKHRKTSCGDALGKAQVATTLHEVKICRSKRFNRYLALSF